MPSGSRIRVDYSGDQPVLAVKLQELFGWSQTPRLAGGRVPLLVHLLSPAGRPGRRHRRPGVVLAGGLPAYAPNCAAATRGTPGREDPATAEPTRRTNARRG